MNEFAKTINTLIESSKFFYDNKQFKSAADLLAISINYVNDKEMLNALCSNARMCYFMANDVESAYKFLQIQEQTGVDNGWEILRDKANYLRYLNQHELAYETAKNISDDRTRNLAISWFLHKEGKTNEAFVATELSRENSYWWKSNPTYNGFLWNKQQVKNIVVIAESGWGDEIIFSRWIKDLKPFAENVYYDGIGSLPEVFARNYGIKIFNRTKEYDDLHFVPVMSLPYLFNIQSPQQIKYLESLPKLKEEILKKYPKNNSKRIGVCFHGELTHIETTLRTLPAKPLLDAIEQYGEIVSLQKDGDIIDPRLEFIPFTTWDDTLALMDTCDIIITCDTGVSHAAAALGKTTIVLMHAAAYFTWNHNEDVSKSLWYKDAWCIHQDKPCNWEGSIKKCSELVKKLLGDDSEARAN